MERRALIAALLLSGCFASHERSTREDAGAARDAGAPPGECALEAANLDVSVALREGPTGEPCVAEGTYGDFVGAAVVDGGLEITVDTCRACESPNACVLRVANLHPSVAAQAAQDLSAGRFFDVWFEARGSEANVRDTSLCDGPDPTECDLLFHSGQSELAGFEDPIVDFAWDVAVCTTDGDPCDPSVHRLAVTGIDPILITWVAQGEIDTLEYTDRVDLVVASSASTRSPCTDEPPPAEWATWVRAR